MTGRSEISAVHALAALAAILSLVLAALPAAAQITASRFAGFPPFSYPVVGDVNGDGLDDIVGYDTVGDVGKVYLNQGDGLPGVPPTFVAMAQDLPYTANGFGQQLVGRLGDLNGDGHVDIFRVPLPYFGDGTGNFTVSAQAALAGGNSFVPEMKLADLNNDGYLDAVTYRRGVGPGPFIYENDGTGVFTLVQTLTGLLPGSGFTQAQAVDFNGDSYLDLVVDGSGGRDFYVLLNDGNNSFSVHFQALAGGGTGAADMDGDGNVDVVNGFRTFFGDGAAAPSFAEVAAPNSHLVWGFLFDLDFDGYPDSVRSNWTYFNDGTGLVSATLQLPYSNGTGNKWMDIGDLIGDGVPEIVSTYGPSIVMFTGITPPNNCPDPVDVDYGGFTAANCAGSVVKAKDQTALDAYLADFGVGGGAKPKHLNVLFNPTGNVDLISPCRIKMLGAAKLIDVTADRFCVYGRAGVTIGAGTPAAGSLIDVDGGDFLLVSEEGKVQTKPGISYIAGEMEIDAEADADVGSGSTIDVTGPLAVTSVSGQAVIQNGSDVTVDSLTMSADQAARIGDAAGVDVTGDLSMTSTSSAAEIQAGSIVVVGGAFSVSGLTAQIGGGAEVDVTGTATLVAAGSATASDAEILSGATLTAADVSQTAEHKAVLSGGATIDAGAGNALIDAPVCVINGTVVSGSVSGACLP